MPRFLILSVFICVHLWLIPPASAQPKPVPRVQAVPQPYDQVSFQQGGIEIARFHFGSTLKRPFVFPVIGPSGLPLTRMGHPQDPVGHSHHNSVWIAHNDVNGVSFWADRGKNTGTIVHQRIEKLTDGDTEASVTSLNHWIDDATKKVLLVERRKTTVSPLPPGEGPGVRGEWLLLLDLQLESKEAVTLGKTPFGIVAVRMAKSIGVNDGGGTIRNSGGAVNEKEVFWKPAKWVDYSGAIKDKTVEGITLFDHPSNPNHPSVFHVRNDGWMGSSLTFAEPRKIEPGKSLRLRYGVYVHAGMPSVEALEARWSAFAKAELVDLTPAKKK
ncbi:MAG: hypothetical protein FJ303_24915 [Planctomycetes bacterium]|nr:hypothetical protein [Planctomycetota bacterium]